jgi:hypothetical protein
LKTKPLPHPFVELHFGLLQKFDDNGELLPIDMGGPAALAAHDKIVAIPIVLDATFERDGGGLDGPLLPRLGTGSEIAIVSPGEFWKWTIVLLALSIVLEDQIRKLMPTPA